MSNPEPIELDVTVRDEASAPLDTIAAKAAAVEDTPATVAVDTTGVPAATEDLEHVETIAEHINKSPAVLDIQTNFASARADLENAEATIGKVRDHLGGVGQAFGQLGLGQVAGRLGDVATNAVGAIGAMSGPLAAIGPLAIVGSVAAYSLGKSMQSAAEVKALNVQNVKDFTQALLDGSTAAETLAEKVRKTGELKIATLDGVKDLVPTLAKVGVTVDQFSAAAAGGKDGIAKLGEAMKAAGASSDDAIKVLVGAATTSDNMAKANERAAEVTKVLGDNTEAAGNQAQTAAGKQDALAASTDGAAASAAAAKSTTDDYIKVLGTIPPDKRTEFLAAVNRGDVAAANAILDDTAAPRTAVINVAVHGANIGAQIGAMVRAGAAAAGGQVVSVTNVHLPAGARGVDALREVTGAARRSGSRYGSAAVSRARR